MKVLIVDQHILFSEGLARLLSGEPDFEVIGQAQRVQEAVDSALALQPDLVLLDVDLLDGSGLDALQQIMARRPESTVVILTHRDTDEHLFAAFHHGARGYLLKDTSFAKLLTALRALPSGEMVLSRRLTGRIVQQLARRQLHLHDELATLDSLTARELEVLEQLGAGATNRDIADRLVISEYTVKAHVRNLLDKLGLKNRSQAAGLARRLGLNSHSARPRV